MKFKKRIVTTISSEEPFSLHRHKIQKPISGIKYLLNLI